MKLTSIAIASLVMGAFSTTAYSQDHNASSSKDSGVYGALGVTTYDFNNYGADVKLGYNINTYLGVEAQGTLGLTTDSSQLCASPECATKKEKVDYTLGAFAVGRIPLNEQFEVFVRAGIHNTKYNVKINNALGTDFDVERTGFAGGGGVQYKLDTKNAIRAEYTYLDNTDSNAGAFIGTATVSYVRKF